MKRAGANRRKERDVRKIWEGESDMQNGRMGLAKSCAGKYRREGRSKKLRRNVYLGVVTLEVWHGLCMGCVGFKDPSVKA